MKKLSVIFVIYMLLYWYKESYTNIIFLLFFVNLFCI